MSAKSKAVIPLNRRINRMTKPWSGGNAVGIAHGPHSLAVGQTRLRPFLGGRYDMERTEGSL